MPVAVVLLCLAVPCIRAEPVGLVFDWPPGLEAIVSYSNERISTKGGQTSTHTVKGSYRLSVSEVPDGRLIQYADARVEIDFGETQGMQKQLQELLIKAMSQPPSFVVNRQGDYVRLHRIERLQANLREMVDLMAEEIPESMRGQTRALFEKMLTPQALESGIIENWNRDVGFWAGATLDLGDWYEVAFTNPVPILTNVNLPMKNRYRILERVPCSGDESDARCVRLELMSVVDEADLEDAVERFIDQFAESGGEIPEVHELTQDKTVEIVTEPGTLRPHSVRSTKTTDVEIEIGGTVQGGRQVEKNWFTYTYVEF